MIRAHHKLGHDLHDLLEQLVMKEAKVDRSAVFNARLDVPAVHELGEHRLDELRRREARLDGGA